MGLLQVVVASAYFAAIYQCVTCSIHNATHSYLGSAKMLLWVLGLSCMWSVFSFGLLGTYGLYFEFPQNIKMALLFGALLHGVCVIMTAHVFNGKWLSKRQGVRDDIYSAGNYRSGESVSSDDG